MNCEYAGFDKRSVLFPSLTSQYIENMEAPKNLSREAIEQFKDIYHQEFHQNISDDEAQDIALRLLRLFDILLRPIRSNTSDRTVIR
jgi:hypothetical protein